MRGGEQVQRPQTFGVGLLGHQRAAHIGVVDDGDPRRGLVGHLSHVGALHACLRVIQCIQIARRQGRNRLGADHHSRVLDDLEHLGNAVVAVADEPSDGGDTVLTERQLARRRGLQPHLVLEPGDEDAVAFTGVTGLKIRQELRDDEQAQALGAGPGALGPGEHQMHDVLEQVVGVAVGDEPFDTVDVPGAVGLLHRLRAACTHIGTSVGFGQHHGGGPIAFDRKRCQIPLLLVPDLVNDVRHDRARHVKEDWRIGAQRQFVDRPRDHRGRGDPAERLVEPHAGTTHPAARRAVTP